MKLAIGLLFATSASALVLVCGNVSRLQVSPIMPDTHRKTRHVETVISAEPERVTAIHFTRPSVGCFLIEDGFEIVWYSGIGGELVTLSHAGSEAIGGRIGYILDRWDVWPDMQGRLPAQRLIESLQKGIMSADVDRIVLGMPLNAPDREVAARIVRKEFKSIDHLFDWAAYAARQNRREFVPTVRHATILAANDDSRNRACRAAHACVSFGL